MICPQCGTLNKNDQAECVRCHQKLQRPEMEGKICCVNHANREATTSCASCGVRLCSDCAANANGVDFCDSCAPSNAIRPSYEDSYGRVPILNVTTANAASFGERLFGLLVDGLIFAVVAIVLAMLFWLFSFSLGFLMSPQSASYWLYRIFMGCAITGYFIALTAMTGQTPGKQVAGVIVLQRDGQVISLRTSAIRFTVSLVSLLAFGLGFLWALWDPAHETWHDKAARTRVFRWEEMG